MNEPIGTRAEVAAYLRVSEWVVGQMCRDGRLRRLPGIRQTRIPWSSVHELLETNRIVARIVATRRAGSYDSHP